MRKMKIKEGWEKPWPCRKYHYFFDGESICGNVLYDGPIGSKYLFDEFCKACDKKLERRARNGK